ncbi:hypothetical protein QBC35DRAFT_139708 [Podospora australis]|uniref:Aflatoxin regulatory protein domain-containing protein n=1 Tax=Podospora australis TaxID=1536484 RepID=A0AAN7AEH5_9PEZI|nr:hypothetical protein QBC35DRAFT_139708 [Podospora australis]
MAPPVNPDDHHTDTEMADMTEMMFDSEWLEDYTRAATALGSESPDFTLPTVLAAEDTERATTSSGASTIVEHERPNPATCQNANKPHGSCVGITTGILTSMRGNSPLCLMGSPGTSLSLSTVDSVLSAAQEAVQLMRGLLDCPICRAGPQLQLLATVVFAEVISRYRRVISTYRNIKQQQQQQHGQGAHEELKRAPLSIGSHQIEGSMEAVLVGGVVSSRLQELEAVMGDILVPQKPDVSGDSTAKIEGGGGSSSSSNNNSNLSALLGGLYNRRDSFLGEQLTAGKQEVTDLLRFDRESNSSSSSARGGPEILNS